MDTFMAVKLKLIVFLSMVVQVSSEQDFINDTIKETEPESWYKDDSKEVVLISVGAVLGIIITGILILFLLMCRKKSNFCWRGQTTQTADEEKGNSKDTEGVK